MLCNLSKWHCCEIKYLKSDSCCRLKHNTVRCGGCQCQPCNRCYVLFLIRYKWIIVIGKSVLCGFVSHLLMQCLFLTDLLWFRILVCAEHTIAETCDLVPKLKFCCFLHNRCLRTQMVRCSSDGEFLGKLHCVRLAFQYLFRDSATWMWFADTGRQLLADLLIYAEKVWHTYLRRCDMRNLTDCSVPLGIQRHTYHMFSKL